MPIALNELKAKAKAGSWAPEAYFMDQDILENDFEGVPALASYAFVAYLHGLVEHGLSAICDRVYEKKNLCIQAKHIAGSPIERAKIYLTKVVGIAVGNDRSWQHLMDLELLRHTILHAGGEVQDPGKIVTVVKRMERKYPGKIYIKTYHWPETRQVHVSLPLCRVLLGEVEDFFGRLLVAVGLERVSP